MAYLIPNTKLSLDPSGQVALPAGSPLSIPITPGAQTLGLGIQLGVIGNPYNQGGWPIEIYNQDAFVVNNGVYQTAVNQPDAWSDYLPGYLELGSNDFYWGLTTYPSPNPYLTMYGNDIPFPINFSDNTNSYNLWVDSTDSSSFKLSKGSYNNVSGNTTLLKININGDVILFDDKKVVLGNSGDAYIKYSPNHGAFLGNTLTNSNNLGNAGELDLDSIGNIFIYANTQADGGGIYSPSIALADGTIYIETDKIDDNEPHLPGHIASTIQLIADDGKFAGYHDYPFTFKGLHNSSGNQTMLMLGYISDGTNRTENVLNIFQQPLSFRNENTTNLLRLENNGQFGIGGAPTASALVDVQSTTKGFLPPRMTTTQRDGINGGVFATGLMIYNTTTNKLQVWDGSTWQDAW